MNRKFKNNGKRRLLSFLLCAVMMFTILPAGTQVFAEGQGDTIVAAEASDMTYGNAVTPGDSEEPAASEDLDKEPAGEKGVASSVREITADNIADLARGGSLTVEELLPVIAEHSNPEHDRIPIEAVDEDGNELNDLGITRHITSGWLNGTYPTSTFPTEVTDGEGSRYAFIEARVNGESCLFVGHAFGYLFFSVDGALVSILEADQYVALVYRQNASELQGSAVPEDAAVKNADDENPVADESFAAKPDEGLQGDEIFEETENSEPEKSDASELTEENPGEVTDDEVDADEMAELARAGDLTVDMLIAAMSLKAPARGDRTDNEVPVIVTDVNGNVLTGDSVPTVVSSGWFNGTAPESNYPKRFVDSNGHKYSFMGAKVNEQDCVFVGNVMDYVFFSTDGNSAVILESDQQVTLIYKRYYTVTLDELVQPGANFEITPDTAVVAINGQTLEKGESVDVLEGDHIYVSVIPGNNGANNNSLRRYTIEVMHASDPELDMDAGLIHGPYDGKVYEAKYDWVATKDLTVSAVYNDNGNYWVFFPLNSGRVTVDDNVLVESGYGFYTLGATSFNFHLRLKNKEYPRTLALFGQAIEVPEYKSNYGNGTKTTEVVTPDGDVVYVDVRTTTAGLINPDYIIDVTIRAENGEVLNENYEFDTQWGTYSNAKMELRVFVNGQRDYDTKSIDVYFWNNDQNQLVSTGDGYVFNGNAGFGARALVGYYFRLNPGYRFVRFERHGAVDIDTFLHTAGPGTTELGANNWNWATLQDMPKTINKLTMPGRVEYNNNRYGYNGSDMTYAASQAYSMGLTHAGIRVSRGITGFERYRTEVYTERIRYDINFTSNISEDINGNTPALPSTVSLYYGDTTGLSVPTATGYVFTGYKLVQDTYHPDDRYNDSFSVNEDNYMLTPEYIGNGIDPAVQHLTLEAQFVRADAIYKVHHIVETPYTDGAQGSNFHTDGTGNIIYDDLEVAVVDCAIVDAAHSSLTALGIPLMYSADPADHALVRGYEFDYERSQASWMKLISEMSGTSPSNDLYVYYKVATVTVHYESSDESMGTVSPDNESRLYHDPKLFQGGTAVPKWNAEFVGWRLKGSDEILSTDLTYVPDQHTEATYVAYFNKLVDVADLSISKTLSGDMANTSLRFAFNVTLTPPAGSTISLPQEGFEVSGLDGASYLIFENNTAAFSLGDGDVVTIKDLPVGWSISVAETENSLYTTSYVIDDGQDMNGSTASLELSADGNHVSFTNTRQSGPVTGFADNNKGIAVMLCFVIMLFAMSSVWTVSKRKYEGKHTKN